MPVMRFNLYNENNYDYNHYYRHPHHHDDKWIQKVRDKCILLFILYVHFPYEKYSCVVSNSLA